MQSSNNPEVGVGTGMGKSDGVGNRRAEHCQTHGIPDQNLGLLPQPTRVCANHCCDWLKHRGCVQGASVGGSFGRGEGASALVGVAATNTAVKSQQLRANKQ